MYEDDELIRRKRVFAAAFLKTPLDPMAAAYATDPRRHYATVICNTWQFDSDVQTFMREIEAEEGSAARIPTRDEVAAKLYSEAQNIRDKDTALKYYDLLSKIMGYVERPATTQVNVSNTMNNNKVLVLPQTAQLDDWAAEAENQQRELVSASG